ncbi:MAG: hypothetical protein OEO21_01165 [Candidatus Krumholzibacteria bacterium]|nr:hypothetical protein [Candidatus Krumholzibacteria bacterium]
MSERISLKQAERRAFTAAFEDGLWDIFIGCVVSMFAIAPFLSARLGDFWSSAVFLPFFAAVFLVIRALRKHVVVPRIGRVTFGAARKAKLMRFNFVMLAVNIGALALGAFAAVKFRSMSGWLIALMFALILLTGASLAAYLLGFRRLYLYGLMLAVSPLVGEWVWVNKGATHHGFPITFGVTAGIMIFTGLVIFVRLLRHSPLPSLPSEEA